MQVLCLASTENVDVQCSICGETYSLYFDRKSADERREAVEQVRETLDGHHDVLGDGVSAHPRRAFNVPEWNGPAHMSAAALLGGAPVFA